MLPSQPLQLPSWLLDALEENRTQETIKDHLESFIDKEVFHDNIHGSIWLNRVEVRVINTPEFQRLRWISQLAFAQYVFNTAEHSRFSHSLGACHVSKGLVDNVNNKMAQVWMKSTSNKRSEYTFGRLEKLHECQCKRGCSVSELPARYQTVTWSERVVISLATLLHDLPHCPFSHDIEGGYPELPRHDNYATNPAMRFYLFDTRYSTLARVLEHFSSSFLLLAQKDPRWRNDSRFQIEENSPEAKSLLAELIFELHAFENQKCDEQGYVNVHPIDWPAGIEPSKPVPWPDNYLGTRWADSQWRQLYRHDIVENTICADLLDYLERDSLNAGTQNTMDFKFLEQMRLDLYEDRKAGSHSSEKEKLRVVFDLNDIKRGTHRHEVITELFNFLQQRYFLRERVCYHRVTQAGAAMLKRAAALVFLEDQQLAPNDKRLTLQQLHLDLRCNSDDSLLRYLATNCGQDVSKNLLEAWDLPSREKLRGESVDISRRLLERRLYRAVFIMSGDNLQNGSFRGVHDPQAASKELYDLVMLENTERRDVAWMNLRNVEREIASFLSNGEDNSGVVTYCLKPGLGYKIPAVLVRWTDGTVSTLEDLKAVPNVPLGVAEQIDAMKQNYTALWRLFVFVKPEFLVSDGRQEQQIKEKCEQAISRFLQWAHTTGRDARYQNEPVPAINMNIDELISAKPENCRDVRFAYRKYIPNLSQTEVYKHENTPVLDGHDDETLTLEVTPPLSWRDKAEKEYGFSDANIKKFVRVFNDEGVGQDETLCSLCIDLLAGSSTEARRDERPLPDQLREIVRSYKLRQ